MTTFFRSALISAAALAAMVSTGANAANATANLGVTITINATCSISAAGGTVAFGSHTSTETNIATTGSVTAQCTNGTPYSIGLDNGAHYQGSNRNMLLVSGTDRIAYGLFLDAAHQNAWSATGASSTHSSTGTGLSQVITVYGLVPAANVPAGDYTDTVVATITY